MKKTIQTILVLVIFCSCGQQSNKTVKKINIVDVNKTDKVENLKVYKQNKKKIGQYLFNSILDTINIKPINHEFLSKNEWIFKLFNNCNSYLKFKENGKGISYSCEMDEKYDITYKIENNKVYITEYDIPQEDNEEMKKIKSRYDTYVYNGKSLIMIDSKMYNIGGLEWTPEIEVVINYDKKKS